MFTQVTKQYSQRSQNNVYIILLKINVYAVHKLVLTQILKHYPHSLQNSVYTAYKTIFTQLHKLHALSSQCNAHINHNTLLTWLKNSITQRTKLCSHCSQNYVHTAHKTTRRRKEPAYRTVAARSADEVPVPPAISTEWQTTTDVLFEQISQRDDISDSAEQPPTIPVGPPSRGLRRLCECAL